MLTELRNAENIYDFARLIGYQPKAVAYLAIILDDNKKYYTFDIPKKGGGKRTIWAPKPKLKALQKSVSDLIYKCLEEFPEAEKKKSAPSYGYRIVWVSSGKILHRQRGLPFGVEVCPQCRYRGFFWLDPYRSCDWYSNL